MSALGATDGRANEKVAPWPGGILQNAQAWRRVKNGQPVDWR